MLIEHLRERSDLGVISARALRSLGVSNPWGRCRPGGPWQRMYDGVVLLHNGPPTRDQQVTAALLRAGPGAVLTGAEACRRHGLPASGSEIQVLVPGRGTGSDELIVERASPPPAFADVGGFPVVSAARAVVDSVAGQPGSGGPGVEEGALGSSRSPAPVRSDRGAGLEQMFSPSGFSEYPDVVSLGKELWWFD